MEKTREKSGNPLVNVLKEEWRYLEERRKYYVIYVILFAIAGLISLATPLVIGLIFNSIQENITSEQELMNLIYLIFLLLAIDVGFWIFHGSGRLLEERTGFFVHRNFVNDKINKVLNLPTKWHKDHHSGDTIDKINRAGDSLFSFSQFMASNVVYAILNIVGSLIVLFFIDFKIALFALTFSLLTLFMIFQFDRKLIKEYKALNKFSNKVAAAVFDYISNIFTVITLRLKNTVSVEVDNRLMASYPTHKRAANLNETKWGFASISISLMTVLVLSYKAYTDYTTTGVILIGTLYILYGYLGTVGRTFFSFAELYGRIVRFDSRLNNVKPIDDAFKDVEDEVKRNLPRDWDEIEIEDVDFSYDVETDKKNLHDVSIRFKRGQKIALIGESGSGKSTILSVLRGLYAPEKGKVVYKGKEIDHGFARLKHHITLIPQDPEIFNNTIGYNINMDLKTTKEEMDKAIRMAQFEKVLPRLEKGLDTNVMEKGVSLSGGEKQRLALARGLLASKSSDIILMDEPTSSVDSVNEVKIHDNVFREFKDKTVISSIHRLHLLNKFDYIYMFDNGKIVAEGSLNEMKRNPKFMRMWNKHRGRG